MPTCRHCGCGKILPPTTGFCPVCGKYMGGLPGCLWFLLIVALVALLLR